MNRAQQLKNAVESCVRSALPEKTQFVIVDNGSADNTEAVVRQLKETISYDLVYQKEPTNLGVGGGRNRCFDMAEGEYVYFLDDDAEIAEECRDEFFLKSLNYLDDYPNVATLTTHIVDHVFGERKAALARSEKTGGLSSVYTFHGGTVFVRKDAFVSPLFLNIMYGNEEISLSMGARDRGYCNVYDPSIHINHLPQVNKWQAQSNDYINMLGASNLYAIKKLMYPGIFLPVLWAVYKLRIYRYRLKDRSLIKQFKQKNKAFCSNNQIQKIRVKTVLLSLKEFGMRTF